MLPINPCTEHLSALLHEHLPRHSLQPPSHETIGAFMQSIALDRIHFNHHDWQGRPVAAMLWHMPDLRAEKKTVVAAYIVEQWHTFTSAASESITGAPTRNAPSLPPAAAATPAVAGASDKSEHCPDNEARPPADPFYMSLSSPRRDWFDRFTDWVAAVVSLFA